jgi:hypothetical protein
MISKNPTIVVKGIDYSILFDTWYNITLDDYPYLFQVVNESSYSIYDINMLTASTYVSLDHRIYKAIKLWEFKQTLNPSTVKTFNNIIDEL